MQISCSNCQQTEPMPEGFWYDWQGFQKYAERHGHLPKIITTTCPCGAVISIGPGLRDGGPIEQGTTMADWLEEHEKHEAAANA